MGSSGNLLLLNGQIYPGGNWETTWTALAIRRGRVTARGDDALEQRGRFKSHEVLDLKGRVALPGFIDSHIHLTSLGESLNQIAFPETASASDIQNSIARDVESREPGEWIIGGKWSRHILGGFPDKTLLDAVSPEHPVVLHSKDLHSLLLNSAALRELGITADTPEPKGGVIRRMETGEPDGLLQENAMSLYEDRRPRPSGEALRSIHQSAATHCLEHGITAVQSIEYLPEWVEYQEMRQQGQLELRMGCLLPVADLDEIVESGYRSGQGDDHLWVVGIKIFTDGALGSCSAWMKSPYEGSNASGISLISKEELQQIVRRAHEHWLSVGIHAIGDAAVGMTVHVLGQQRAEGLRDRIEHFQLVAPEDFDRIPAGLIASVQPIHMFGDREPAERVWGKRSRYAYPLQSLMDHKALLAFGSDAPVEDVDPWSAIQAAVERRSSGEEESWYAEEQIPLNEALTAYTLYAARAAYRELQLGSLRIGAAGDLMVLDRNPWETAYTDLSELTPVMTVLDGRMVYESA